MKITIIWFIYKIVKLSLVDISAWSATLFFNLRTASFVSNAVPKAQIPEAATHTR